MKRFSGHNEHLDTDLNIVPIIDCFVMLICFLLFTAAFTQLVYLEAKLTTNTAQAASKSRSELDMFRLLVVVTDSELEIKTSGSSAKKLIQEKIAHGANGEINLKRLHQIAIEQKSANPDRFSVDIEVRSKGDVSYEKLIGVMDAVRHLEDEEYAQLRIAEKKIRKINLSEQELNKPVTTQMFELAERVLADPISAQTDHKLLFPDIALLNLE